ncbi:hypothetical protein NDU88_005183 [Pleurodeles waltl]|uniref:Uncharacterized protein n=1 Tax=Pleurodeles waltl TaxID=8319 RepID=A0AAV7VKS0_PLEWA|nr:hypothetical protein NDU88_005183 [Pleurodeles waltl]
MTFRLNRTRDSSEWLRREAQAEEASGKAQDSSASWCNPRFIPWVIKRQKEDKCQKHMTFGEISKSEENVCTQELLIFTPEEELYSLGSSFQDLPNSDSLLEYESSILTSEISQDDIGDLVKINNPKYAFSVEDPLFLEESIPFHPEIDDLPYDADVEDYSMKSKLSLSKSDTGPNSHDSGFAYDLKTAFSNNTLLLQSGTEGPSAIVEPLTETKIADDRKEQNVIKDGPSKESERTDVIQMPLDDHILQCDAGLPTIMQEPLLDCIVRESPNKEVSSFLTKSDSPLVFPLLQEKNSIADIVNPFGNKNESNNFHEQEVGTEQTSKIAEASDQMQNMGSQDSLDEYITLFKFYVQLLYDFIANLKR